MIEDLIAQMESRFAELGAQLTDPEVISDRERYAEVGRAYSQLEPAAKLAAQWRRAQDDVAGAEEMLQEDGEDPEVRVELTEARERIEQLEEEIRLALVERDPNDAKNVIVEIQGGAGGDEAGLWAGDLYRMLVRYAERCGFQSRSEEHTSELQSHRDLHSFPTRRSSDLDRRDPGRGRGRRGRTVGRRPLPDARPLRRAVRVPE